ncbi:hypothetical protein GLOTRDRAFT_94864 [Gloeophyllum trabeum ATCC 11539]|uniref:Uncharacterized protein n=1 Tax=Gloeophyllum trabeum (strain ATCC 11539 / FP-39264 / Madison 617) TaxID=670483 RepID=S7Q163_GLOTA|nr:uncharacterized protein GLOTRDRAFT_94864 [Gloeophyllum trabeum ATCC 11539]EPQ53686.1 hypothetical protein GLOTRDRAFT_94864 [Gloeophyllum trabeum ATCC 11539]
MVLSTDNIYNKPIAAMICTTIVLAVSPVLGVPVPDTARRAVFPGPEPGSRTCTSSWKLRIHSNDDHSYSYDFPGSVISEKLELLRLLWCPTAPARTAVIGTAFEDGLQDGLKFIASELFGGPNSGSTKREMPDIARPDSGPRVVLPPSAIPQATTTAASSASAIASHSSAFRFAPSIPSVGSIPSPTIPPFLIDGQANG